MREDCSVIEVEHTPYSKKKRGEGFSPHVLDYFKNMIIAAVAGRRKIEEKYYTETNNLIRAQKKTAWALIHAQTTQTLFSATGRGYVV